MKGLSLTLTIVVVAIALIVTVFVVITVFNEQITNFIRTINPWSEEKVSESMCRDRCTSFCNANLGKTGTGWDTLKINIQGNEKSCDDVMRGILGEDIGTCEC